ncbi:MAG: hypothetical protein A2Y62_14390 [Candidatus Fischerbacteria bacterium RBG_13_37_8]|uniref:Uncharacterized protein n=1 Tax=Candidatus Fischerbacteria bacterium RBG_13_37_8 TaxID=1817863 RepID=A0A1F5VNM9_9BACT|nr:MAG: hypothetical protein A2Y62_14390 [Candidatus Fischerbacteria bacterium RBG_13_37_8]
MLSDPIAIIAAVVSVLEGLHIIYYIGGSFASSLYGIPRSSQDVDIIADIRPEHVNSFVQNLQAEFYVDETMVRNAISHKTSFNIIHFVSSFKIDIFLAQDTSYSKKEISRRNLHVLRKEPLFEAYFASAEDIILEKLIWFKLSNEVMNTQWKDVLGIMRVRKGSLDIDYLKHWSTVLDVSDLLEKAFIYV